MKGKRVKKISSEDPIFVELQNPAYIRREVLSGAIECIDVLKNYEVFKDLRVLKEKKKIQKKKVNARLYLDYNELKVLFPNYGKMFMMRKGVFHTHHEHK